MANSHIRVLCVDDHPIVREGLELIIGRQPDMEVVGSAATGEEALDEFARSRPDVTLMDLRLPGMTGLETIRAIRRLDGQARIAVLTMYQNWAYGKYRHLFGRLMYRGRGVYGFSATGRGSPLDGYGRNIYVDTFDSAYGRGWHRENSFLTHHRGGTLGDFCYGFFPHSGHPSGHGTKYRATVEGPGVTPDVMWAADDIGAYDATVQQQMQDLERSWRDPKCRT